MAETNKPLVSAAGKAPAPQFFNEDVDSYEVQKGRNGASFTELKGDYVAGDRIKVDIDGATINASIGAQESKTADAIVFQNAVTSTGNGTTFTVGAYKTLTLEIAGTSTDRTIIFEGASVSGVYYPIMGVKLADLSMATQTTGSGEVWTFEITGLVSFRARLASIAGGNVTVKGKAVA